MSSKRQRKKNHKKAICLIAEGISQFLYTPTFKWFDLKGQDNV